MKINGLYGLTDKLLELCNPSLCKNRGREAEWVVEFLRERRLPQGADGGYLVNLYRNDSGTRDAREKVVTGNERWKVGHKPGSVLDSHSSGMLVTEHFKRSTRGRRGQRHSPPI